MIPLHVHSLVSEELLVVYVTWPPTGCVAGCFTGWSVQWIMGSRDLWLFAPFLKGHWQSFCTALTVINSGRWSWTQAASYRDRFKVSVVTCSLVYFTLTSHISMGIAGSTAAPSGSQSARSVHMPAWQRHNKVCCSVWVISSHSVCVMSQAWIPWQKGLQFPSPMCVVAGCVRISNLAASSGTGHSG